MLRDFDGNSTKYFLNAKNRKNLDAFKGSPYFADCRFEKTTAPPRINAVLPFA